MQYFSSIVHELTGADIKQRLTYNPRKIPTLLGIMEETSKLPSKVYSRKIRESCIQYGIDYTLKMACKSDISALISDACADRNIDGIIVYYPIYGDHRDAVLRNLIPTNKDVEGLNNYYQDALYNNRRSSHNIPKHIVPCTPLACIKILHHTGFYESKLLGTQLSGTNVAVFNRSDVVGKPLAAMLYNDGATVYSIDVNNVMLYTADGFSPTSMTILNVLDIADVVFSAVPSTDFVIKTDLIKEGALCVNVSHNMNFEDDIHSRCRFVSRIGSITVLMLLRNLIQLCENDVDY